MRYVGRGKEQAVFHGGRETGSACPAPDSATRPGWLPRVKGHADTLRGPLRLRERSRPVQSRRLGGDSLWRQSSIACSGWASAVHCSVHRLSTNCAKFYLMSLERFSFRPSPFSAKLRHRGFAAAPPLTQYSAQPFFKIFFFNFLIDFFF